MDRAIDSLGIRINEPVKVNMEDAWLIDAEYQYSNGYGDSNWLYFLINKLYNVRHPLTKQQAMINPAEEYPTRKTSAQAKELAQQLGLTSQQ